MTFDPRARAAVLDIHRAVEVMEMTTSTKEPRTVERFDRFRDRKQRNRRIGAILVAGALVVTGIVVVSMNVGGKEDGAIPATPGALEGRLLFEVYGGDRSQLYAIDAAGGPVQDLGLDVDPGAHWSPDGKTILVTSTAGPAETALPGRPATVASDGSDFRLLDGVEDRTLNLACLVFSPDGTRIACGGFNDLGVPTGIYTVRATDGGGLRMVTDADGVPADYSPEGEQIVFVGEDPDTGSSSDEAGTLFVVGSDGTNLREITEPNAVLPLPFTHGGWSPDGQWIVFMGADRTLRLVHPDGTDEHAVPLDPDAGVGEVVGATWSPDGAWIAFSARSVGEEDSDIYLVRPDGSELQQLTETPSVGEYVTDWTA